jgi:hypothetical protein
VEIEVTVYGGAVKRKIIDNGTKKEGSGRKERGKFQTAVITKEHK